MFNDKRETIKKQKLKKLKQKKREQKETKQRVMIIQCNFFYLQIFEKVLLDLYCVTPLYEILFDKTVHLKPYLNHDFLILQLSHRTRLWQFRSIDPYETCSNNIML
jgi:hypothetical protein